MGLPEEAGKTATGIVAALTGTPVFLVLILLNIIVVAGASYYLRERAEATERFVNMILQSCLKTSPPT